MDDVTAVLEWLGIDRSHGTVWNWMRKLADHQEDPFTAAQLWVAVNEKQIEINGEERWLFAAIDIDSKMLFDVYSRRGTDPTAAFLHRLTDQHDVSVVEFLFDGGGYLTALARHKLSGQLNYTERNHIEKWFPTVSIRADRFYTF